MLSAASDADRRPRRRPRFGGGARSLEFSLAQSRRSRRQDPEWQRAGSEREAREARDRLRAYQRPPGGARHQQRRRVRDNIIAVIALVVVAALATVDAALLLHRPAPACRRPRPVRLRAAAGRARTSGAPDPTLAEGRTWTGDAHPQRHRRSASSSTAPRRRRRSPAGFRTSQSGYYDGKTCHRLARRDGFGLLQCGSLDGDGAADPAFTLRPDRERARPTASTRPARSRWRAPATTPTATATSSSSSTGDTTLPADAAGGYTVIGTVTSGLDAAHRRDHRRRASTRPRSAPTAPASRSCRPSITRASRSSSRALALAMQ